MHLKKIQKSTSIDYIFKINLTRVKNDKPFCLKKILDSFDS